MDPNATLQLIINATDNDEFYQAFCDLFDWLDNGGFPPVVNRSMMPHNKWTKRGTNRIGTTTIHGNGSQFFAIQCVESEMHWDNPQYEFVRYNGDTAKSIRTHRIKLPKDKP